MKTCQRPCRCRLFLTRALLIAVILLFVSTTGAFPYAQAGALYQQLNQQLYLPLVTKNFSWQGAWIEGKVVDARDQDQDGSPDPLDGVKVCTQYQECADTDQNGTYHISLNSAGSCQVTAAKEGYISLTQSVDALANQTVKLNFVLSPPLQDIVSRVVLTWDSTPKFQLPNSQEFENDLDAYLFMVHQTGALVIYYGYSGQKGDFPHALLLYDARDGAGPETIDISVLEQGYPPTVYHYAVHHVNYLGSGKSIPSLAGLQARVCIYFENAFQANCYSAPEGTLQTWYVFSMDQDGNVTLKNCLTDDPPDTDPSGGIQPPECQQ